MRKLNFRPSLLVYSHGERKQSGRYYKARKGKPNDKNLREKELKREEEDEKAKCE